MVDYKSKPQQSSAESSLNRLGVKTIGLADNRKPSVVQQKLHHLSTQKDNEVPIQKKTATTGLPDQLKSGIESLSGHSMNDVKVHYNSAKPRTIKCICLCARSRHSCCIWTRKTFTT